MRRVLAVGCTLLFFAALPAAAQSRLPAELGDWRADAAEAIDSPRLETFAGTDAPVLREYGIAGAERRRYARGDEEFVLTLYRMRDPTGAFGAFSYFRSPDMVAADIAPFSAIGADRALFVVGSVLVEARGAEPPRRATELKSLASLLAVGADKTPYPILDGFFPHEGRIAGSDRFLLGPVALGRVLPLAEGDWVGFHAGAEAQLARYRTRAGEITLLIASFPTPQTAAQQAEALGRWFVVNPAEPQDAETNVLFARRSGSLVAIVTGTRSPAAADALLSQISHNLKITWNEPGWAAEEESFTTMLYGIFLGTGLILVAALAIAFAFGGFRLVVKRLFPGKVFDRPEQMQILQLGLNSKPIDSKDFY
jgi:hypothetical protein